MITAHAPSDLRRKNRDLVLRQIASSSQISRARIAKRTGLTPAAVWRITRELIDVGLVAEGPTIEVKGQLGRPNVRLVLDTEGAYVLGITLGVNMLSVAIANTSGEIVSRKKLPAMRLDDPYRVLEKIVSHISKLINRCGIDRSRILGAGVVVAGQVDYESGVLIRSDTLGENWTNISVGQILSTRLGFPHGVESRPGALLLAELWSGRAVGLQNVYLLNSSVGLGSSQYVNGQLLRPEAGHDIGIAHYIVPGRSKVCQCGRKGCLQAIASGFSILEECDEPLDLGDAATPIIGKDEGSKLMALRDRASAGDRRVKSAFYQAGRSLGFAVYSVLSIANPQAIILAGIVGRQPDYFAGVVETLRELRGDSEEFPLHVSEVTSDGAAVWLGLDRFFFSRKLDIERLRAA